MSRIWRTINRLVTPSFVTSDCSWNELRIAQAAYGLSGIYAILPPWFASMKISKRIKGK